MVDILSLQPNVISRDLRGKYILLAGQPKVGKTEFICSSEDALVCAFEIGTNAQSGAYVIPIDKWSTFKQVVRQLETPEAHAKYKTLGLDTIGIAFDLCEKFICQQNGVQKLSDIPYGAGYAMRDKEFEETLRKITMMSYGLIMTCHLKETYDEDGKLLSLRPDLNNRCYKIVNGLCDVICSITQTWDENGESHRWIRTRPSPTVFAGSRYKYLDPVIPFGFNEFEQALARAIDEAEKHGAKVVDSIEAPKEVQLSFSELRNEASELWTKLMSSADDQEYMYNTLMKKIEIIFGKKIKLSEVTEDQVDLMELVVIEMRSMVA